MLGTKKKDQLLWITRALRRQLEAQRDAGADGFTPAPTAAREAFAQRARARERARLQKMRDAIAEPATLPSAPAAAPASAPPGDAPWKTIGARPTPDREPSSERATDAPSSSPRAMPRAGASIATMSQAEKMAFLRDYLGDCQRCKLAQGRTKIVFGDGAPEARLVFVGEGPGYHEDKSGIPFVGKAGGLLDKMIAAMGLERAEVYICNVVKCRPPKNRDPQADEIRSCSPFLYKQLEVIDPEVIVTLGRPATRTLLETDRPMRGLRGRWHEWRGHAVMPTYHPAYLLRAPDAKREAWSDLQQVVRRLAAGSQDQEIHDEERER